MGPHCHLKHSAAGSTNHLPKLFCPKFFTHRLRAKQLPRPYVRILACFGPSVNLHRMSRPPNRRFRSARHRRRRWCRSLMVSSTLRQWSPQGERRSTAGPGSHPTGLKVTQSAWPGGSLCGGRRLQTYLHLRLTTKVHPLHQVTKPTDNATACPTRGPPAPSPLCSAPQRPSP